jgi:L-alanine-DL-glutamate epimerase-like enolase superfamily enzyme
MAHPARIVDAGLSTREVAYRTPMKFRGVSVAAATLVDAWVRLEDGRGRTSVGRGTMPLGNVWAFPSDVLTAAQTLHAMRLVVDLVAREFYNCPMAGHPIEIAVGLQSRWPALAHQAATQLGLAEPIPLLAVLVCASPFDAALHDGYGKLFGVSAYEAVRPEFLGRDLGDFLGPEFDGVWLDRFIFDRPQPSLSLYHLVGAADPLAAADVRTPVGDGRPESLSEWIGREGLTHLKIKLSGDDPAWDLARIRAVDAVACKVNELCGIDEWFYSLDFNERCADPESLVGLLGRLRETHPGAFDRVQYIEQPGPRDLARSPRLDAVARLKPVVLDEGLLGLDSLVLARELGYTGIAVKACKGQSLSLLMVAAARRWGMPVFVQDLTCPGAAFVQSAGLAAHIPGVTAVEGNSRQYCPDANTAWEPTHPGLFRVRNGRVRTAELGGPGLSAYPPEVEGTAST